MGIYDSSQPGSYIPLLCRSPLPIGMEMHYYVSGHCFVMIALVCKVRRQVKARYYIMILDNSYDNVDGHCFCWGIRRLSLQSA